MQPEEPLYIADRHAEQGLEWPLLQFREAQLIQAYFIALAAKRLEADKLTLERPVFRQCQAQLKVWGMMRSRRSALAHLDAIENGMRAASETEPCCYPQQSWQKLAQNGLITYIRQMDMATHQAIYPQAQIIRDVVDFKAVHERLPRHFTQLFRR